MSQIIQPIASNPTTRYELIEVLVNSNSVQNTQGGRVLLGDQELLRTQDGQSVYLESMETWDADAVPFSWLSTNPNAPAADIANAALVLNVFGTEQVHLVPLVSMNRTVNGNAHVRDLFTFDDLLKVDWTKSYIQFAAAGTATAFSYLFGVRFSYTPNIPPGARL